MSTRLTVVGATGTQGGAVIEAALAAGGYQIRGITRNTSSQASVDLQAKGVEMVKANLLCFDSVKEVFADSDAIFAMTDFFQPFAALEADAEKAMELEWKHALNIVTAAAETPTLKHFVWSTLPHATNISEGKYNVPHFAAKNRAEDYIKHVPDLLAKTTFLWVGWYASNFQYPIFKPTLIKTSGTYAQFAPVLGTTPITSIGDTTNIGPFVIAALQQPSKTLPGKYVSATIENTSMRKLLDDWSEASEKEAIYIEVSMETYDRLWPGWGLVEGEYLKFSAEFGERAWPMEGVLTGRDLGVEVGGMKGVLGTLRGMSL
ncbi:hypothetical protein PRZ48_009833 [Zasmidium cellare]|uniref:NmrA-like domain-containing protein n=1 Tax=Zasmidium cellare TaxID=395010 RepID=A0ABR0EDV4_ZASCE|nr:hypothetical protein PRZ48_009833 [Zasmidium cellare]